MSKNPPPRPVIFPHPDDWAYLADAPDAVIFRRRATFPADHRAWFLERSMVPPSLLALAAERHRRLTGEIPTPFAIPRDHDSFLRIEGSNTS